MINRVVLNGRFARDVEIKKSQKGESTLLFTLAFTNFLLNTDGTRGASFIKCCAFGKLADYIGNYGKKGKQITVEGRIFQTHFKTRDGVNKYEIQVFCDGAQIFADKKASAKDLTEAEEQIKDTVEQETYFDVEDDLPF